MISLTSINEYMEKIRFTESINAPKEKVWEALWNDDNYRKWTSVFSPESHAITDWKEGSKVLFLDGKGSGMVSKIDKLVPNQMMSFLHLGVVKNGEEDTTSEAVKQWAGSHEDYFLQQNDGTTELTVELDSNDEFKTFFQQTFPKALRLVKEISENN